jgi:hypothetical protein
MSAAANANPSGDDLPRWQTMEPFNAKLRPDQVVDLVALRKEVAKNRTVKTERITDNTLLRIALDLLFAHQEYLKGNTEDELRDSILTPDGEIRKHTRKRKI